MGQKTYGFEEQLKKGQVGERDLSDFFSRNGYDVVECQSRDVQRQGIDALFTVRKSGKTFPVEYKTDTLTQKTGNIFVETASVLYPGEQYPRKEGWAYTSQAKFLIYAAIGRGILVILFDDLRSQLPEWESVCLKSQSQNKGYVTKGILVPYDDAEYLASVVIPWSEFSLDKA